jgi:predicted ATPase
MGKTRLALDLAWQHTEGEYRDGVTFVPLRAIESPKRLIPSIAQALYVTLKAAEENAAREELLQYLRSKQLLLVLDNCEHLLPELQIISEILQAGPEIQILATSRERLRLPGEHVFALQGVRFDNQFDHPAAQLFTTAAQRIVPDFEVNQRNTYYVNRIIKMVDGMPLALELAAAWLDTMPASTVAAEVEQSLDFLAAASSNLAPRHRSLRALLDTTWGRLAAQERQVFAALAVFRGSFSWDAAKQIAGANPAIWTQLIAHSLLKYDRDKDRYELHEMLRHFAAEKLAATPQIEHKIRQKHFNYYSDLAQLGGAALRGGDQAHWLDRLETEQTDIHQAIDWAVEHDIEAAAGLVVSLHVFWFTRGLNQEAIELCERLLPHKDRLSAQIYPWLLAIQAEARLLSSNKNEAEFPANEALPLFKEQKDDTGTTFIYSLLTTTARRVSDDLATSIQLGETGLKFAPTTGPESYYTSLLLETLSDSLIRSGQFDEADAYTRQGYKLCMQRDDRMCANYLLDQMSFLALMQNQLDEARRHAEKCLDGSRKYKMLVAEHLALEKLIVVAVTEGDFDLAEQYVLDRLILSRKANFPYYLAGSLLYMGNIQIDQGRYPEALPYLLEAAYHFQRIEDQFFIASVILLLSKWVWHEKKDGLNATRWFACALAAQDHQLNTPISDTQWASFKVDLEVNLGEEALDKAWAEGQKLSLDEALEEIHLALPP